MAAKTTQTKPQPSEAEIMEDDGSNPAGGQTVALRGEGDAPLSDFHTPPSLAVALTRAEVDQQIATARAFPRSITTVTRNILTLATLDEQTAQECIYALPRAGKAIRGPSIRMAEIIVSQWGNCRVGARVVHVDRVEKYVEAEGVFHDLETNTATTSRVRRRISDKRGRVLNDDMIVVTGNAACSIAKRNAVLGGIPKAVWRRAYDDVEHVIAGDVKTLAERRSVAMKAFATFGITPDQVCAALEVAGIDDIGLDELVTLTAMHSSIKSGESSVEEMFPTEKSAGATTVKGLDDFASGKRGATAEEKATRAEARVVAEVDKKPPAVADKAASTTAAAATVVASNVAAAGGEAAAAKTGEPVAKESAPASGGGKTSQDPASGRVEAEGGGGGTTQAAAAPAEAEPARVSAGGFLEPAEKAKLQEYAAALASRMTATSLQRAGQGVFGEAWPDENTGMGRSVAEIYNTHNERVAGRLSAVDADRAVKALLAAL